jgi:hypothetical protein
MPVTALVSAKSCGVTTSALAMTLASRSVSLLAECDPAGGTIRAGFASGQLHAGTGLYHLAAADRTGPDALAAAFANHLWHLDPAGHRKILAGLTDPAQAAALGRTWPSLSQVLHLLSAEAGYSVFVDAGRLALESGHLHPTLTPAPLIHQADLVLLVVRSSEQFLTLARHVIEPLRAELIERGTGADALGLLLLEDGDYRPHHVQDALRVPVLAALPWEPATAHYLTFGGRPPRGFDRSLLMRYARTATEQLEVAASRRQIQQQLPDRMQMAGVLQRLGQHHDHDQGGGPRV